MYDRVTDRFRRDSPRNVGAIKDDYTFDVGQGIDARLETGLSRVDGAAVPVLAKLRAQRSISGQERQAFAEYLAYFVVRVPGFTRWLNEVYTIEECADTDPVAVQELVDATNGDFFDPPCGTTARLQTFLTEHRVGNVHQNHRLHFLIETAKTLRVEFYRMDWVMARPQPSAQFVTSDNPLLWGSEAISFPVAHDACLLMFPGDGATECYWTALMRRDVVHSTNVSTARHSERVVISPDEKYLRRIVEAAAIKGRPSPPLTRIANSSA